MKTYGLYLKSDGISPDFKAQVIAETHRQALMKFRKQYKSHLANFDDDTLLDEIGIVVELNQPKI